MDSAKEAYRVSQDDTYLIVLPDEPVSAVGSTHSLGGPPSPENSQLYVNVPEGNHSSRPGSSHPVPPRPCEEVEGEMEYDYPNVRFGLPGHLNSKVCQTHGALDEGSPMSPVDFKKWQCPLSLLLTFSCRV